MKNEDDSDGVKCFCKNLTVPRVLSYWQSDFEHGNFSFLPLVFSVFWSVGLLFIGILHHHSQLSVDGFYSLPLLFPCIPYEDCVFLG